METGIAIIIFLAGLMVGWLISRGILRGGNVGTLHVDCTSPEDTPVLYLDLNESVGYMASKDCVTFTVKLHH